MEQLYKNDEVSVNPEKKNCSRKRAVCFRKFLCFAIFIRFIKRRHRKKRNTCEPISKPSTDRKSTSSAIQVILGVRSVCSFQIFVVRPGSLTLATPILFIIFYPTNHKLRFRAAPESGQNTIGWRLHGYYLE